MLLSHRRLLTSLLGAALCLFLAVPACFAISPSALGSTLPDAVVIDANFPAPVLQMLGRTLPVDLPLCAAATSLAKVGRLA